MRPPARLTRSAAPMYTSEEQSAAAAMLRSAVAPHPQIEVEAAGGPWAAVAGTVTVQVRTAGFRLARKSRRHPHGARRQLDPALSSWMCRWMHRTC